MMNKNTLVWLIVLLVGVVLIGYSFVRNEGEELAYISPSSHLSPEVTASPSPLASPSVSPSPLPKASPVPVAVVSCRLQGEIKFLTSSLYDNQDAKFIYSGIDHPARNILWTVTPQDDLSVGPNIFDRLPIPNGESLLGIVLPAEPVAKKYELTAKVQYGQLVDGTLKVLEKQCSGKTTVVLPE
ncbi:MAG: hypothetical protein Q7S32_04605 [bacterium]|nr:hypothetical protein [bacterium]